MAKKKVKTDERGAPAAEFLKGKLSDADLEKLAGFATEDEAREFARSVLTIDDFAALEALTEEVDDGAPEAPAITLQDLADQVGSIASWVQAVKTDISQLQQDLSNMATRLHRSGVFGSSNNTVRTDMDALTARFNALESRIRPMIG